MTLAGRWHALVARLRHPREETVDLDDAGVTRHMIDGRTETMRWDDLRCVDVITTGDGPLGDDFFWLLQSEGGGCAVPGTARGADALLARLQTLPGFDNDAVIRASTSTADATFACWRQERWPA